MRQRCQDLVRVGDNLFSKRFPLLTLWQSCAENFHVMRADFTRARYLGEEFGSYLMTGRPARCHRDLSNAFSAMLRPRDQQWFHAQTDNELVNEDRDAKIWLDEASKKLRRMMYDQRAGFVRATKMADQDFAAFGNAVITREVCDYDHLIFQAWHLRDTVWAEDAAGVINQAHFDWRPEVHQLKGKFRDKISPKVAELGSDDDFKQIKCRRIVLPVDQYDLPRSQTRDMKFVSIYVDVENLHVMEEVPLRTFPVTIPRFAFGGTMYGAQYGYSPATIYGLPDARMMQMVMLSLLDASEKATRPPMIAVGEAINGGVNLFADGVTQTDADYDERTGEVLRPIPMQLEGIKFGAEQLEMLANALDDSFYLSKIRFPTITKEMTAYEASKLWEDFMRESLPLFEPVEQDYNANICDGSFEDMLALGRFGTVDEMPQMLKGRDINWQFDTPISVAADKALTQSFQVMLQTIVAGAQADPDAALIADIPLAARDAIDGSGAPAKWLLPPEKFEARRKQKAEAAEAASAAHAVALGADVATRVAGAAESAASASQALQGAGYVQGNALGS